MSKEEIANFMAIRAAKKAKDALEKAQEEYRRLYNENPTPDRKTAALIKKVRAVFGEEAEVNIVIEGYERRTKKGPTFRIQLRNGHKVGGDFQIRYPIEPSNARYMQRFNELAAIFKKIQRLENLAWRNGDAVFLNRCKAWIVETDLVTTAAGASINASLEDMVEAAINS
jgi:ribosomal protein L24